MNDKLDLQSTDFTSLNIEKIAALFPNCVTETAEGRKIDFDLLKQELSTEIVEGNKERYRLEWPGKRESIVAANLPTTKTLRPVREDSVDFDTTENIYIEGDNLEVLKLLQESYFGKIKMIYIDPPYNTGKDFVYKDNFAKDGEEELFESGQKDEYNQRLVANPETSGRYHSDWLSMMYPRLKLARNLLTEDGVIFISIDDNEVHNLRKVCDEVFGEINFIGTLSVENNPKGRKNSDFISVSSEYLHSYARNKSVTYFIENIPKNANDMTEDENGNYVHNSGKRVLVGENSFNNPVSNFASEKNYSVYYRGLDKSTYLRKEKFGQNDQTLLDEGYIKYFSYNVNHLVENTYTKSKFEELIKKGALEFTENKIFEKNFNDTIRIKSQLTNRKYEAIVNGRKQFFSLELTTTGAGTYLKALFETNVLYFDAPKNIGFLKVLITLFEDKDLTVLDFFSGSATTAHAVMQLNAEDGGNRKYIMVQLPEATDEKGEAYKAGYKNICEIAKERIRRAAKKIKEEKIERAKKDGLFADFKDEQDYGFRVYRLDSSNMKDVYYKPQDYNQGTLDLFADNVKEGRTAEDLVTQIMLDWGLPLSLPIERKTISGKEVYAVAGDSLYCCFDDGIDEDFAKAIAQEKPLRIVFRDRGFKDDTAKENVKQLLKQLSGGTEMRVI